MQWAIASMAHESVPLTTKEALSGVFGSISLASWIFLLVSHSQSAIMYPKYLHNPPVHLSTAPRIPNPLPNPYPPTHATTL
jgi:hypothetical protein